MSWNGYLYRLKSREEDMFKVQEELDREVREVLELVEREAVPPAQQPARRARAPVTADGEVLQ